jgi:beta-glucosidase
LIWSFISFEVTDANSQAQEELQQQIKIKVSQNIENYKMYRNQLADMGYDSVKHLIAFGGWNGPHLPPGSTGQELYQIFKDANLNFDSDNDNSSTTRRRLWDGIDWDLEGHDEIQNPRNEFTLEVLNQVGIFSQKAKEDGLIVSMAPPESYLDTTTNRFSRFVNLTYPDDMWHQEFQYHGHNVYAYVMAKYGQYIDFVFVQFYESYSHALYKTEYLGWTQSEFLVAYMRQLSQNGFGYTVNFEDDSSVDLKNQFVKVPLPKIVFGFANGWALNLDKAIFFSLFEISWAYKELRKYNIEPRGCGYWVVEEDSKNGVSLTKDLYAIIFGGDDSQSNSYNALTE